MDLYMKLLLASLSCILLMQAASCGKFYSPHECTSIFKAVMKNVGLK
jgi:hypothetical protein